MLVVMLNRVGNCRVSILNEVEYTWVYSPTSATEARAFGTCLEIVDPQASSVQPCYQSMLYRSALIPLILADITTLRLQRESFVAGLDIDSHPKAVIVVVEKHYFGLRSCATLI